MFHNSSYYWFGNNYWKTNCIIVLCTCPTRQTKPETWVQSHCRHYNHSPMIVSLAFWMNNHIFNLVDISDMRSCELWQLTRFALRLCYLPVMAPRRPHQPYKLTLGFAFEEDPWVTQCFDPYFNESLSAPHNRLVQARLDCEYPGIVPSIAQVQPLVLIVVRSGLITQHLLYLEWFGCMQ